MANKNLFTKFASLAMAGALAFSAVPVGGLTGAFAYSEKLDGVGIWNYDHSKNDEVSTSANTTKDLYWDNDSDDDGNPDNGGQYFYKYVLAGNMTIPDVKVSGNKTVATASDGSTVFTVNTDSNHVITGSDVKNGYKFGLGKSDYTSTGQDWTFNIKPLSLSETKAYDVVVTTGTTTVISDKSNVDKMVSFEYDGTKKSAYDAKGTSVKFVNVNTKDNVVNVSTSGNNEWYFDYNNQSAIDANADGKYYTQKIQANDGKGHLSKSSKDVYFRITPRDAEAAIGVVGGIDVKVDDIVVGQSADPTVTIVDDGLAIEDADGKHMKYTLVNGKDYKVTFANKNTVGDNTGVANITFMGNYKGAISKNFNVVDNDKNIAAAVVELDSTDFTYDGTPKKATIKSITLDDKNILANCDVEYKTGVKEEDDVPGGNPISAGTVTMTIKGTSGGYAGTKTVTYEIKKAKLKNENVSSISSVNYTGKKVTPDVIINGKTLRVAASGSTIDVAADKKSSDYVLNYQNNIHAGKASAIVEGIGNYTGSATASFTIEPMGINETTIEDIPNQVYTGAAIEPEVEGSYKVDDDDVALVANDDYTVKYESNVEVGTASVEITGQGDFKDAVTRTFTIVDKNYDIASATVTLVADSVMYDGANHIGSVKNVKVTNADGTVDTLVEDTDYTVKAEAGKVVGEYPVVVKGMGNYGGSVTIPFTITGYDVADAGFKLKKSSVKYNGKNQKPELVVAEGTRYDGKDMVEGTDYEVSGIKNIKNVGKLTVKVTGLGGYAGTEKSLTFKVTKADQPMKVSTKTASVKASKVAKKNQTIKASKVFSVSKNQGSVSYKKTSGNSKIKVASNGKITVKKGLKKGTYKIKVKVTAKGNSNYNSGNKTVKATIKVK